MLLPGFKPELLGASESLTTETHSATGKAPLEEGRREMQTGEGICCGPSLSISLPTVEVGSNRRPVEVLRLG